MLILTGMVTNYSEFVPAPTPNNPNPSPIRTLEIEGVSVNLPNSFTSAIPPMGKQASLPVLPTKVDKAYKFRAMPQAI